ncbi:asparagine synthase (glutamine-hydrolyzing) [Marinilabiliaceae bacterium JC017]|nr:asparagine synthase (glutamine-hydrolyzing) [Marinilabiliaceae bacterium JC017]
MCGIAGFINNHKTEEILREQVVSRMLTRIAHRGPDECGIYLSDTACFGNVRLSIIDLKGGQQPLSNQDGTLWIAYNGEVFNYVELRDELQKAGAVFKTQSDTEVVLKLYEYYGEKCLNKLNGQFAFSIWDLKRKRMFLARDRMGIRPLFYSLLRGQFVFGSEIKALFEYPGVERAIDYKSLKQVFTFWTTITPRTVFKNILEVPPGHYLVYENGNCQITPYWSLNFQETTSYSGGVHEAADHFRTLLKDAVRLRLRSDVQVAAYLSGGLDSSATTALIKELHPEMLNTFSIGFTNKDFDESKYQEEVSQFFDTRHKSVICSNLDIIGALQKTIWHTEIPLLRTSPIPMMKLSQLVHQNGIKVVITGEGADEALGGYNIFKEALVREFWAKFPDSKIRPLLLKRLYPYIPQLRNASAAVLKMFFGYQLNQVDSPIYSHLLRWRSSGSIANFINEDHKLLLDSYDPIKEYSDSIALRLEGLSTLAKAQYIESTVFMSGYLLSSQGDRMAMANSVEGRYPFLDHRILEFSASLPDKYKLNGLNEKYLLKFLMKDCLPQSVLRRPKQAYRAPVVPAMLNGGGDDINKYIDPEMLRESGLFNEKNVTKLISKLKKSNHISEVDNMALMAIVSAQILHQLFVKEFTNLSKEKILKGVVRNI